MNTPEVNKIHCCNALDLMARMPDGFVDLTVTSPPYDNLRSYNGYEFDFEPIARELYRVTKKGGVVVWVVGDATVNGSETGTSFRQALGFKEVGFILYDTMIWQKTGGALSLNHRRYEQEFEYMFILTKATPPQTFDGIRIPCIAYGRGYPGGTTRQGGDVQHGHHTQSPIKQDKLRGNVWGYDANFNGSSDILTFQHPAPFPEKLARDHILSWSNENDLIYDPFMGSGTTAKAAHQLKRRWIGSEISQEYVDLANKRLEPHLAQHDLF